MKKSRASIPWTGIPDLDFLDVDALAKEQSIHFQDSNGSAGLAIPCDSSATLDISHAVHVPLTQVSLTSALFGGDADAWLIKYQEDSSVQFHANIVGRIVPALDDDQSLVWKWDNEAQVHATGNYRIERVQEERFEVVELKAKRVRVSGQGEFDKHFALHDLFESSEWKSDGSLTVQLKTPPIEMALVRTEQNLLTHEQTDTMRSPWIFFPSRFTEVEWPTQAKRFPHRSEVDRGMRQSMNAEVDLPAFWTSDIQFKVKD